MEDFDKAFGGIGASLFASVPFHSGYLLLDSSIYSNNYYILSPSSMTGNVSHILCHI